METACRTWHDRNVGKDNADDATLTWRLLRRLRTLDGSGSDDFYLQLLEGWPDAVLVFDFGLRQYVYANDAAERLTGYRRDEIRDLSPEDITAPDFTAEIPRVGAILERDGEHRGVWRIRRKDGTVVDAEVTLARYQIGDRLVSHGLARLVDDRAAADENQASDQDDARTRAQLLGRSQQAVVALDTSGVVLDWNAAAEEMYGWPASEAIGRHVLSLAPEGPPRDEIASILSRLQRGELLAGQLPAYGRDGERIRRTATISPIRDERGEITGYLSISVPANGVTTGSVRMRRARVRCVACGREVAGTMRRKYCSEKCRQWAYYHRHIDAQRARSRERHDRRRASSGDAASSDVAPPDNGESPCAAE